MRRIVIETFGEDRGAFDFDHSTVSIDFRVTERDDLVRKGGLHGDLLDPARFRHKTEMIRTAGKRNGIGLEDP